MIYKDGIIEILAQDGSVKIPKAILKMTGIKKFDILKVSINEDNNIVITKDYK